MSSRVRRVRRQRKGGRLSIAVLSIIALLVLVTVAVFGMGAAFAYSYADNALKGLPNMDDPKSFKLGQPTKVYSLDNHLLASFSLENREIVPISDISTDLARAVVAVEDERFYQHKGIDTQGLARALAIDISTGTAKEGASTIDQQYIRNTILIAERYDITPKRKIREMYLATELEKRFTKTQILEKYLNTVYFGGGAYGAEAAAREFFGKHADQLTLSEASLLAGLPQSPIRLNPRANRPGADARQQWVLGRMVANKYITKAQADAAIKEHPKLAKLVDEGQGIYDCYYFVSYIRKQLLAKYTDAQIFKGGFKVYTTIDTKLQRAAEKAVKGTLPSAKDPAAALVAIDPTNGYIKAMYGGRDYKKNAYNTATQGKRQPGSSFKTFVLVTALEKGIPPKRPIDSSSPAVIPSHPAWHVSNSEGSGHGYITITEATRNSVNVVFARLIWELGPREVARTANRMGIKTKLPNVPSIALGSAPVSPLEMASAYGTLAAGGVHNDPTGIIKILDADDNVIYQYKKTATRVLSPQIAWAATQQLMGVVSGGTGTRAALRGREVAGKTGTAQNYQDAWFCGYTPQLVTAVWMGYLRGSVPMRNVHGQRAFGGTFCAPIWHDFMAAALSRVPAKDFARADAPHYIWKSSWNHALGDAKPVVKPKPKPSGGTTTSTPPPTPPTTTTPGP